MGIRWAFPFARLLSVCVVAGLGLAAVGCETHYNRLRLRPVDTTSQLTLEDVSVSVSHSGPGGASTELGVTDNHGQIEIANLRSGQILTLQKEGYETAILLLRVNGYGQKSPLSVREWSKFPLAEGETIPVPMHRVGAVRRPANERK